MSIVVCGSLAYDSILRYSGRFRDHIASAEEIDSLNVSFLAEHMRREFGGCAGNIAYNLAQLGETGYPMATVGTDFDAYGAWMERQGVPRDLVRRIDGQYTSQAVIATDCDDNQITLFHPGAMERCQEQDVPAGANIRIGVVAPEGRAGMRLHARQMAEAGIRILFDPGQGMPMFGRDELLEFLRLADWLAVNEYEFQMLLNKTELSLDALTAILEAVIVTHGARGSEIHPRGAAAVRIPAVAADAVDPTGCGDAYRAGLLYGLLRGWDWQACGRLGAVLGALAAQRQGCQNHAVRRDDVLARFEAEFGAPP